MAKKTSKAGRRPIAGTAMKVTVPLRLPGDIVELVDEVIEQRLGAPSRNAVMREALAIGLAAMLGKKARAAA